MQRMIYSIKDIKMRKASSAEFTNAKTTMTDYILFFIPHDDVCVCGVCVSSVCVCM
jgi:hypothetical protein